MIIGTFFFLNQSVLVNGMFLILCCLQCA